jgi:hypothetical protein
MIHIANWIDRTAIKRSNHFCFNIDPAHTEFLSQLQETKVTILEHEDHLSKLDNI